MSEPASLYIEYTVSSNEPPEYFQKKIFDILQLFSIEHCCSFQDTYLIFHYFILYWEFTSINSMKFTLTYYINNSYNEPHFDMALRHELFVLQDTLESVEYENIKNNNLIYSNHDMENALSMPENYDFDKMLEDLSIIKIA
jgi:hypothetical protein